MIPETNYFEQVKNRNVIITSNSKINLCMCERIWQAENWNTGLPGILMVKALIVNLPRGI